MRTGSCQKYLPDLKLLLHPLRTASGINSIPAQHSPVHCIFNVLHLSAGKGRSVKINHLENQIEIIQDNLIGISDKIGKSKFDCVTVNPPFFKVGNHQINPNDSKAIARHEILATLEDIIKEASSLLNTRGRLAIVHRPERLPEIFELFNKYHIEPKRLRLVYPKMGMEVNHVLIEGIKDGSPDGLRIEPPLYVYKSDNTWTDEVLKIYNFTKE